MQNERRVARHNAGKVRTSAVHPSFIVAMQNRLVERTGRVAFAEPPQVGDTLVLQSVTDEDAGFGWYHEYKVLRTIAAAVGLSEFAEAIARQDVQLVRVGLFATLPDGRRITNDGGELT